MTRGTAKKAAAAAKREAFAARKRKAERLKAMQSRARRRASGPVNVIDGPLPKRKPGKIAAGGALTVAFEFSAQDLRDLRVLAVARGYPVPRAWMLKTERAAAKWFLPTFVAEQIAAGRPKVAEAKEGGAP